MRGLDLAICGAQDGVVASALPHYAYVDSGDRFLEGEDLIRDFTFKYSHELSQLTPASRRQVLKDMVLQGFSSTIDFADFCRNTVEVFGKGSALSVGYDDLTEEDMRLIDLHYGEALNISEFTSRFQNANSDKEICTLIDDALLHLGMIKDELKDSLPSLPASGGVALALDIYAQTFRNHAGCECSDKESTSIFGDYELELLSPFASGSGAGVEIVTSTGEGVFITDTMVDAESLSSWRSAEPARIPTLDVIVSYLLSLSTEGLAPHSTAPALPVGLVACIEVWSGIATLSFVASALGAAPVGLVEKKVRIRTGVAEALGGVPLQATDFYDGEWETWDLSEVKRNFKYLILFGGASCKAFAKCGYQGSLDGTDVRALDVVHTAKMAGALMVDFCTIEITIELLDMNHRHGLFDQTEAAFADHNLLLINTQKVVDSQIGGMEFRTRLVLQFARRELAALIPSVPTFPTSSGVIPLSRILIPVDQVPDFLIFKRGALKAVPPKQVAPFKPMLVAVLKWGGPRYSLRIGSKVMYRKGCAANANDQESRFFVTMISKRVEGVKVASLIKAEPFGERTDPKLRRASLSDLIHLPQYVGVHSIDHPALALRAFGEGLQGNSMLILDTRLSPPAARSLTHLEKWRLHGLCDDLFFFLRDAFNIPERELASCAGEAITMAMAAVIVYSLFFLILFLEGNRREQHLPALGMAGMENDCLREEQTVRDAGGIFLTSESLQDPGAAPSTENVAAVLVDVSKPNNWQVLISRMGLPAATIQIGCKRARVVSRATDFVTKLVKAPVSSAVVYVTVLTLVWMTTHFVTIPVDEAQRQAASEVGSWVDFSLLSSSPFNLPVASCLTKLAAFSLATVSKYRHFSFSLKTGVRDPVPLSKRSTEEYRTPDFDWFDYSQLVESHLRNRLLQAAEKDPFFADWAHQIANDLPSDLPNDLRHLKVDYSHKSLMSQPFAKRYKPPKTDRVPRPVQRRQPRVNFKPTHIGDLLQSRAMEMISDWVVANLKRMDLQRRGYKAGPGERLAIGQDLFTEDARDIVWDLRKMDEGIIKPLDFSQDIVTHLNRKAIARIFEHYPDQELIGFLLDGVQWKVDPAYQLVLLPHLVSLPEGYASVEKELYRLKDRGWYHFFPQLPFLPWRALPQGATARKLEPDRWRRTTDGGAPRMLLLDTAGVPVSSINDMANVKGSRAVADGLVPPVEGEPWWIREVKPKMEELMRDLAVLLYAARHIFNEPPLVFGDDCFNYFSQFALCPATLWLAGLVWLDVTEVPPNTMLSAITDILMAPIFIVENVLGFGLSPNSGICQRMSHAIVHEFMRRMDLAEKEHFEQYTEPKQKEWIKARQALGPDQLRLYSVFFYTDDAICIVVGHERMERALKIWHELMQELGFIMAIPEKRVIGTSIVWLGFRICVIFGLIVIPTAKLLRMLTALARVAAQEEISFNDFRSLVGLLIHLRPWLGKTVRTDFKLWFAGYSEAIENNDDELPVFISPQLAAQARRFHQWLKSHPVLPAISEADNFTLPSLDLSRTIFVWVDAAKEGVGVPGIGGYCHGKAWHIPLSPALAVLPIVILETLAVWAIFHVLKEDIDAAFAVLICTDATSAFSATTGDASSRSLSYLSQLIRNLPVFKRNEDKLWVCHCWGEGNCIADYCSRGLFSEARRLAALLGVELHWLDISTAFISSLEALAESVAGMADMSLPEFHDTHTWFEDLKVFGARFERPITEHRPGLCTFEALEDCGVAASTEEAIQLWQLQLEECISNPSGEVAQKYSPLLQIMKVDALKAAKAVMQSKSPAQDYPGLPVTWAVGLLSVDPALSPAEWIYTVCFGLGHMFGSLVSLHLLALIYNVCLSVCIPAEGRMLRVGVEDPNVFPKAVIRLHDQHATVSAVVPEAVKDLEDFGPPVSRLNAGEAMGSSIALGILNALWAVPLSCPTTQADNLQVHSSLLNARSFGKSKLSLAPPVGLMTSTAPPHLTLKNKFSQARLSTFDSLQSGTEISTVPPSATLNSAKSTDVSAYPVIAGLTRGQRINSAFSFESKSLEGVVNTSPFKAELIALLNSAAWSRWKDFCEARSTPAFRSDPMANSGLDPIGFKEEQNLQMEFLEWVKPLVISRIGPEAKPKSIIANLHTVRRIFALLNFTLVPLPSLKRLEKRWTKDFADKHGSAALLPRRKEPLTALVIMAMLTLANYDFGFGIVDASTIFWASYLAMVATSASAGFRRAEVSSTPGNFSRRDLCRSNLKWIINGSEPKDDPSLAEFASMKNHSSYACISPAGSKGDPGGNYWGQHQIFLPLDTNDPMNAAVQLRNMEQVHPCHGEDRAQVPLFSTDTAFSPFDYQKLDKMFQAQIKHLFPNVPTRMYSWHSFRIFLACALLQMDADVGTIQALCRWKTLESLQAYARLTPGGYGGWLRGLSGTKVTNNLVHNIPRIGPNTFVPRYAQPVQPRLHSAVASRGRRNRMGRVCYSQAPYARRPLATLGPAVMAPPASAIARTSSHRPRISANRQQFANPACVTGRS